MLTHYMMTCFVFWGTVFILFFNHHNNNTLFLLWSKIPVYGMNWHKIIDPKLLCKSNVCFWNLRTKDSGIVLRAYIFIWNLDIVNRICITILHKDNYILKGAKSTENRNAEHPTHFVSIQVPATACGPVLHAKMIFSLQGLHLFFMWIFGCCQNLTSILVIWLNLGQLFFYC